ncbi:hypothetical protein MKEN_00700200 [Mycena kentingensis (nom. inval.)]|nr:hypothetical protein MKEN_00700200 [Mycena kentingensis (nom. inval.)]
MAQQPAVDFKSAGENVVTFTVGTLIQTFFFGVYTLLVWFSTRMLLSRKLKSRVARVMFAITVFMYALAAFYQIYSIANVVDRIRSLTALGKNPSVKQGDHTSVTKWSPLFNAVMLSNYVISDGVVVWRAWVLCQQNHRKFLWVTVFFGVMTALSVLLVIIFRVIGTIISPIDNLPTDRGIGRGIDCLQVLAVFLSLLSNLTALAATSVTAWNHWKSIRSAFSHSGASAVRTNRILLLVVETGVLYCFSALVSLLCVLIRLPYGTMGDIYFPISVQVAGAYPSVVLLLVSTKKSLSDSTFGGDNFDGLEGDSFGVFTTQIASKPIHFVAPPRSDASPVTPASMDFATDPRRISTPLPPMSMSRSHSRESSVRDVQSVAEDKFTPLRPLPCPPNRTMHPDADNMV